MKIKKKAIATLAVSLGVYWMAVVVVSAVALVVNYLQLVLPLQPAIIPPLILCLALVLLMAL